MTSLRLRSLFGMAIIALTGCGGGGTGQGGRAYYTDTPESVAQAAIQPYDTNKDGKLDAAELAKAPHLSDYAAQSQQIPLTAEYLATRIGIYQNVKGTFPTLPIKVTWQGNPLADADVTATPEEFHKSYPTLKGKTGPDGTVELILEKGEIPFGFYKISISKGAEIPAIYNSATTLKLVFFPDTVGRGGKAEFRLTK